MARGVLFTLLLLTAARAEGPTGELDLTFTERSPLSAAKILTERLGLRDVGENDDLANTHFRCYVPPGATEPMGLIVWLNYRNVDAPPKSILPLLDRTHTIFVVTQTANQEPWARVGLALDAGHNLKQRYAIDPRRTWCFSLLRPDDTIGQQMGLAFPDAFAGFVYLLNFRYFRPIGPAYAASFNKPLAGPIVGQAKLRRHLLVGDRQWTETNHLVQRAYWQDGFADTQLLEVAPAEVTYPNLDAAVFAKIIETLTAALVVATPASRSSEPAAVEPDAVRLLHLAKNLITAGANDSARAKLRELLSRFPQDPAAAEARQLLDTLNGR